MALPIEGRSPFAGCRILEIGEHCLIGRGMPEAVDYACTNFNGLPLPLPASLRCLDPLAAIRAVRAGHYGLVIFNPTAFAAWQTRVLRLVARRPRLRGGALLLRSFWSAWLPPSVPVVMLDIGDAPILYPHNAPLLDRSLLCFKRDLPADRYRLLMRTRAPALADSPARRSGRLLPRLDKFRPISSGLAADVIAALPGETVAKTTDIFFAGEIDNASTVRRAGLGELLALKEHGVQVDLPERRLSLPQFLARAAAACLTWSPEGLAHDCFRHYEVAACGSVPVINTPGIERYRPLEDNVHAIYYGVEAGGLRRAVLQALEQKERLRSMGEAARRHVLQFHTHEALARYVLSEAEVALRKPDSQA
jgi:hypothetical protein